MDIGVGAAAASAIAQAGHHHDPDHTRATARAGKQPDLTFSVTAPRAPHTVWGFGGCFSDRRIEAGVPGHAHGLRKVSPATAAENGATTKQPMAWFGWLSLAEAERYTQAAERARMALAAMGTLLRR